MLTVPITNQHEDVLGVMQVINAKDKSENITGNMTFTQYSYATT